MATDLYKVLGVDKKASADEIKKAHRKLVRQYHPDRNPDDPRAEERFKEVQHAYDVLGDPDKRRQYDRGGLNPFGAGGPGGPGGPGGGFDAGSFSDILSNLFGGAAGGPAPGGRPWPDGRAAHRARPRPRDRGVAELRAGRRGRAGLAAGPDGPDVPHVPRHRRQAGHRPEGLPALPGPRRRVAGRGPVLDLAAVLAVRRQRDGHRGQVRDVRGLGLDEDRQALQDEHPRRGQGGQPRAAGRQGRAGPQRRPARRPVRHHPRHRLAGVRAQGRPPRGRGPAHDPEALRGAEIEVPTLNGRKRLRVPAGTKHGTVQRLRGEGPPLLGGRGRADIRYRFTIDVPDRLSREQEDAVARLEEAMGGSDPRAGLFA
jgi:molecular chaperone DnaJ